MSDWTVDDDAAFAVESYPEGHPFKVVSAFMAGMADPTQYLIGLRAMVTPESLERWGDFSGVAELVGGWASWGIATRTEVAEGAPDVAYVRIVPDATATYQVTMDAPIDLLAVFTTVWRPEVGFWQIHAIGQQVPAQFVPRTSPGVAPSVDLWQDG